MNHEEGNYQLSHAYDSFVGTSVCYLLCQEPDEESAVSSDEDLWQTEKCQGKNVLVC